MTARHRQWLARLRPAAALPHRSVQRPPEAPCHWRTPPIIGNATRAPALPRTGRWT